MIDVIVVSFNSGDSLIRCCESLAHDTAVARILVVDNTPGGADAKLVERKRFGNCPIETHVNSGNRGFGRAVNWALDSVVTDYAAIVNPDGVVRDNALNRLVQTLARQPEAIVAGARVLAHSGTEQRGSRRREPTPRRLFLNTLVHALRLRHWYHLGFELSGMPLPARPVVVDAVSGACVVARTEALKAIGGFDPRFFLHFEDLDLCKRLRDAGGEVLFVPDAVFHHAGGGSSASRPYFVIWHKHLSMVKYYLKHYRRIGFGGAWLPLILLMAMLRCTALMGRRLISGRL